MTTRLYFADLATIISDNNTVKATVAIRKMGFTYIPIENKKFQAVCRRWYYGV